MAPRPTNSAVLKRDMRVGFLDAETDHPILKECFVDNGNLARLMDTANPASLVIGRTGSGKTALLQQVAETCEKTAIVAPEELSLHYLTNSTIIQFFE